VTSLHCPPTLVVARHARAAYVETWFSDEGGSLTGPGREQARRLARSLAGERVAAVWTSDTSRAVQTGEIAAAVLGVGVTACKSLREVFIGDLLGQPFDIGRILAVAEQWHRGDLAAGFAGGESGVDVVARHRAQLDEVADLHSGETVLVIGHQTALGIVLPTLTGVTSPDLDNAATVRLVREDGLWIG
jgi:probable phosphoglycerate mutase